ncbi:zinc knuckle (CCHC-type) family protein [Abeliophyllum distichum]|uniref:Zinc knuckle (CCHC-type) family protein n=1 Tax=Abeliophyllum distichum TaxID=126358 RepID=A0ABD1PTQ2_9LAMI
MATDPITEVVATENQTVATVPSPSVNQTVAQVPSFAATQTVAPTGHVTVPVNHGEKPEKFNGLNFKRWQQKMLFYLTTLNLARFLNEDAPETQTGLADSLYNVYNTMKTAKELWESLDHKYKTEDAGAKKFIVGRFLDYKIVDSKTVISQVQELQVILHEIHAEGMVLSETFQVAAMIEKLPPTWKDFKNYLKHKRNEMNIEELIVRLRIEEDNKSFETRGSILKWPKQMLWSMVKVLRQTRASLGCLGKARKWVQKEEFSRRNFWENATIVTE